MGHLIRRAQQVHNSLWNLEVSDEVTSPQLLVLVALDRTPGMDQRSLGLEVSLDRSTTADVVERLMRKGLLERSRDPSDRRRNTLRLTEQGQSLLAELHPRTDAMNELLLSELEPADRAAFVQLFTSFVEAAESLVAERLEPGRDAAAGG